MTWIFISQAIIRFGIPLSDSPPLTTWVAVILAGLTIIYAIARPMLRRKDPLDKAPNYASLSKQRMVEKEMQNVLVELSEMTRQISAQLDTRAAKLELLIKEADEKLAALKAANAQPSMTAAMPASLAAATPGNGVDPRYVQIYSLADQGRSAYEIAQQLSRPSGEIELILALRKG